MTSADDILDQIDDTLSNWTGSADSMHWTAAEPSPAESTSGRGRNIIIQRLIENQGLSPDEARAAVRAVERQETTEHEALVASEARAATEEMAARLRAAFQPMADAAIATLKQLGESIARLSADNHAFRHLPEALGCNDCGPPAPPRDRPAWQSKYGPARRRR
ncbi:hypothetical protein [Streptomyces sp. NPDC060188]|uniref:hypothetical protein n=1 Tax=Streptomyces sp. NPDC060188 TaxID=3347068 RepID=UPI003662EE14